MFNCLNRGAVSANLFENVITLTIFYCINFKGDKCTLFGHPLTIGKVTLLLQTIYWKLHFGFPVRST